MTLYNFKKLHSKPATQKSDNLQNPENTFHTLSCWQGLISKVHKGLKKPNSTRTNNY